MNKYWLLEPEVAGGIGPGSLLDARVHPPKVTKLEHEFEVWLGDDLLETFPCYIVTARLAEALTTGRMTGFALEDVQVVLSSQFRGLYPNRVVPEFRWLKISGTPGIHDFSMSPDHRLVVSDAALTVLKRFQLAHCEIEERGLA